MRTRSTTIIAAGILIAIVGGVTVIAYARSIESRSVARGGIGAFAVDRDVAPGTKGEDVARIMKEVSVPVAVRPATAIAVPTELVGRIAVRPIAKGEVVTSSQFGATGIAGAAPASGLQIPPGHNAVTMSLPVPQGVARYAQPGDLVNVYATLTPQGVRQSEGPVTRLILSNVLVLSNSEGGANGRFGEAGTGEVLLTLSLRPQDAEKMIFAKENGSVWLGLVHPGDSPVSTSGQSASTVVR